MATIDGWTSSHAAAVRELAQQATGAGDEDDPVRVAARYTNGLPVYCDIGGCLVITAEGEIVEYAFEGSVISLVTDRSSIRLARAAAAEKYEALADLKPTDGVRCSICNGTGRLGPLKLRCGVCDGTGLVLSE